MSKLKTIHCYYSIIGKEYDFKTYLTYFDPNIKERIYVSNENKIYFPVTNLDIIDEQNGI